jgi:hypothetical protein
MLKISRWSIVLVGPALLAGCQTAVLFSESFRPEAASAPHRGLVYSLPKGQVQIDAKRVAVTDAHVKNAELGAKAAIEAADAAKRLADQSKAALDFAEELLQAGAAALRAELTKQRDLARAVSQVHEAQYQRARKGAEAAAQRLEQLRGVEGGFEQTVSLKLLPAVPDPMARFVVWPASSSTRDDNVKLALSNGMLNTATSEVTGQMGSIVVNLVSAVSGAASGAFSARAVLPKDSKVCKSFARSITFDPTDRGDYSKAQEQLKTDSFNTLALRVSPEPTDSQSESNRENSAAGLFYRVPKQVLIEVVEIQGSGCISAHASGPTYSSLSALVPDSAMRALLPMMAGHFTKSRLSHEFKDGMPISFGSEQQSQLAAVARIPVDILKAIVEVPAELVRLRVNYDSQSAALIEAQTRQLKAEIDLLKMQEALRQAQPSPRPDAP